MPTPILNDPVETPTDQASDLHDDGRPAAGLHVDSVRITGFRSLVDVSVSLELGTTYLVGENNVGKSSILAAIAVACGVRRATNEDLHMAADGSRASKASIDLFLRSDASEFPEVVAQRLAQNAASGPASGEWTGIRTTLSPVPGSALLAVTRRHLIWDSADQAWVELPAGVREQVLQLLAAQFLDASRDLLVDLAKQTSDWGKVLVDLGVLDDDRIAIESALTAVATELQRSSPVMQHLQDRLSSISSALAGVDKVEVRAIPGTLTDLSRSIDVLVASGGRPGLPLRYQGMGSRSLAALLVFHALCDSRVGADRGVKPSLVLLLEEPEAHMHPQAQVAVRRLLEKLPGQAIITTHSNVLLAEAPLHSVRLVRANHSGTVIRSLKAETAKKVAVFRNLVSRPLGELFFARLVVFADGIAELNSLPLLLAPLLGRDPAGAGVTFVSMDGMKPDQCSKAIEALKELGNIPWIFFLDRDKPGLDSIQGLSGLDGIPLSPSHDQVVMSGAKQLERMLVDAGYHDAIRKVAEEHAPWDDRDPRHGTPRLPEPSEAGANSKYLEFLSGNKSWAPELVAKIAASSQLSPPPPVAELASKIRIALGISGSSTSRSTDGSARAASR